MGGGEVLSAHWILVDQTAAGITSIIVRVPALRPGPRRRSIKRRKTSFCSLRAFRSPAHWSVRWYFVHHTDPGSVLCSVWLQRGSMRSVSRPGEHSGWCGRCLLRRRIIFCARW